MALTLNYNQESVNELECYKEFGSTKIALSKNLHQTQGNEA